MADRSIGRPRRYSEFERFVSGLPERMEKRPRYLKGIGVFRGARGDTAWIKIRLIHGTTFRGKSLPQGSSLEIKLGNLASWSWEQLTIKQAEMQGLADRGEPLEKEQSVLFRDWAGEYLNRAKPRVSDYASLKTHVHKHFLQPFGNRPLDAITTNYVNSWISSQLEKLTPGTVKRQLNTLKAIFSEAVRAELIEANPCRYVTPITGLVSRQRFLTHEELARLLVAAQETAEWLPDFIIWDIHSGMRRGEILNLIWTDIQSLADNLQIAMVRTSKTDQPRMVTCTSSMTEVLERQRERKKEGSEAVFPVAEMTLRRKWMAARKMAGLEDVTMHDLRRTHSTHAAAAGVDLRTLAGRIGHTDLSMLQKHYAAIVGTASMEAAQTIEATFRPMTDRENSVEL